MLDKTVDTLSEHALEVALTGSSASIGCHHSGHGSVGTKERPELGSGLELRREDGLEHGEEEMLFSRLVLVSVEGEHDGLEKSVRIRFVSRLR